MTDVYQWVKINLSGGDTTYQLCRDEEILYDYTKSGRNELVTVPPLEWLQKERAFREHQIRKLKDLIRHIEDAEESYIT